VTVKFLSLGNQLAVEQIGCVDEILLVSRRAGKIAEQDLSLILVLRTNETQPQQKAAECIFLILCRLLLAGNLVLIPGKGTQGGNKMCVCLCFLSGQLTIEPGE
jgi:hypothetical protein